MKNDRNNFQRTQRHQARTEHRKQTKRKSEKYDKRKAELLAGGRVSCSTEDTHLTQ